MTIETALYSYLSTKAEVTAAVSTRIFPQVAAEGTIYPFVVYSVISDNPEHDMDGAVGLTSINMQIDVWSETIALRMSIAEIIRNVLDGFRGNMGTENLYIQSCFLDNRANFEERDTEGKADPVYRSSLDFSIWHVETVPTL